MKPATLTTSRFTDFWVLTPGCIFIKFHSDTTTSYPQGGRLEERQEEGCSKNNNNNNSSRGYEGRLLEEGIGGRLAGLTRPRRLAGLSRC